MVRIYFGNTSKKMQWVVRSTMRVLVFTKVVNSKGNGDAAQGLVGPVQIDIDRTS